MNKSSLNVCVLGAGVVGCTVADILQHELRDANITIVAEAFREDLVSTVAAGIFRPSTSFKGSTKEITKKWIEDSWHYWQNILRSAEAPRAGIMAFSAYIFSKENYHVTRNHYLENLVPIYRVVTKEELQVCGQGWKYGSFFTTFKVGCERYLPWVEEKFVGNGGKIVNVKVDNFSSFRGKFDVVLNCTGMGAKYLCNDDNLVPLRGQVIKVKAPWLKTAFYGDYDTYVIPGFDGIATLGGVRQYESYDTKVSEYDAASIKSRCCELLPGLKKAEVVAHKVGLRPHRVPVRVEQELVDGVRVVHCYGHGGYGVMTAPGTALHAVNMATDFLKSNVRSRL